MTPLPSATGWNRLRRFDWMMMVAATALMGVGICFIYSASFHGDPLRVAPYYRKQLIWDGLGLLVCILMGMTDYRRILRGAWVWYGLAVGLLLLAIVVGVSIRGAQRWLCILGVYVQPAELAKIVLVAVLARYLGSSVRRVGSWRIVLTATLTTGIPFVLIFRQPDLGTAAALIPVLLIMLYVAGVPARILVFLCILGLLFAPLGWLVLDEYQKNRILFFLDPGKDPLGAGWNKIQSEIAVGSGGLWGKGFLKGTQNILGFLPRSVAPTDFIFSVIAEEAGFIGAAVILVLYSVILSACLRTALSARDVAGKLLCVGVAVLLFFHVFVNIGMTVGLCPITGLPLPLVSYGGSVTVALMAALGMVQSVRVFATRIYG